MNKLKMKAKAGVTLVELLVVILIVTILAIALLPLLKPYIEKAKYAAEPIPVIANLQTKIELFQYERGKLPSVSNDNNNDYYTWYFDTASQTYKPCKSSDPTKPMTSGHIEQLIDTDWQDLKGKNMRPSDFQYSVTANHSSGSYVYAVGVFGGHDDSGLVAGTGYAVCKVVDLSTSNKVVAVWERYKPADTNLLKFVVSDTTAAGVTVGAGEVFVPSADAINTGTQNDWKDLTNSLQSAGWVF